MRSGAPLVETRAFVLGRVAYGEADLIVHLLTEEFGRISALARGARRGGKRFAGSLEPMHTVRASLQERQSSELFTLKDAVLEHPRLGITADLEAMEAAGRALGWLKKAAPARTPERAPFVAIEEFLDELDQRARRPGGAEDRAVSHLAAFGLRLVEAFGWGLALRACVGCGKSCPPESSALLSPERGGIVCRACGGGPIKVGASLRIELLEAAQGSRHAISADETERALRVIDRALGAHAGIV